MVGLHATPSHFRADSMARRAIYSYSVLAFNRYRFTNRYRGQIQKKIWGGAKRIEKDLTGNFLREEVPKQAYNAQRNPQKSLFFCNAKTFKDKAIKVPPYNSSLLEICLPSKLS